MAFPEPDIFLFINMLKQIFFVLLVATCASLPAAAQKADLPLEAERILAEADILYKSEMASWHGSDLFIARHPNQGDIGGYFSYVDGGQPRCVFYNKEEVPKIIGTVVFDSSFNTDLAIVNLTVRGFSDIEQEYYEMRDAVKKAFRTDTTFSFYKDTNPNMIPVKDAKGKRVYVISGTNKHGVVPLGNDYLLQLDKNNRVTSNTPLHRTLILMDYKIKNGLGANGENESGIHSHIPGYSPFITATDICTLRLYEPFTHWHQHIVISEDYVSIWSAKGNKLLIITAQAWKKISAGVDAEQQK